MPDREKDRKAAEAVIEPKITAGGTVSLLLVLSTAVVSVMAAVILGTMPQEKILPEQSAMAEEKEEQAAVPVQDETPSGKFSLIEITGILDNGFAAACREDKEKGLLYLKRRFLGKDVKLSLYTMKLGENFWGIAKQFGVNIDTIVGANPELTSINARTNQKIIIPDKRGVLHEVKQGENLDKIAEKYDADKALFRKANKIPIFGIEKGDVLFVPGVKPVELSGDLAKMYSKRGRFRSPLQGSYSSVFGKRQHPVTGEIMKHGALDIRADIGTWVGASADGKVIYAGWAGSLGNCVKIQHADGYMTLYAHLSKIYVKQGQKVKSGKLIAKSGNTGRTTGPHLHFAIHLNGKPLNPLDYLW